MYLIYSLLMGFAALLLTPYWIVQGLRHGKYFSNLGQRLGFSFPALSKLPEKRPGAIWIHAVSVGEALSGVALARRLKQAYPDRPLVISTTTLTGQALARERMPFADAIFYFPLDWAFCVRRVLRVVRPSIVVILETEIWPNFLAGSRARQRSRRFCERAHLGPFFLLAIKSSSALSDFFFGRFTGVRLPMLLLFLCRAKRTPSEFVRWVRQRTVCKSAAI